MTLKLSVVDYFASLQTLDVHTVLVIGATGALLIAMSAPYTIFEMCLGYTFPYPLALLFAVLPKLLGETFCFLLSRHVLRDCCARVLAPIEKFRLLQRASLLYPWQISHIIRSNALMPLFLINFGSGLLHLSLAHFLVPALLWGTFYSAFAVYFGSQYANVQQLMSGAKNGLN